MKGLAAEYVSTAQAAKTLGVTRARVHVFIAEKRLTAVMFGRIWMVERASLDSFKKVPRASGRPKVTV